MGKVKGDFLVGVFDDEDVIYSAVSKVRGAGIKIFEVYSPHPVHGIDEVLGVKRSRLGKAAFMFGFTGFSLAILMQTWMLGFDWPMNIGGKPFMPFPAFVPVTFESTVLLTAFGMVGTFLVVSDLKPYGTPLMFDPRSTDDKYIMVVELEKNSKSKSDIESALRSSGAIEVNLKTID